MQLVTRAAAKRLGWFFALAVVALGIAWRVMIWMPGASHEGPLPPLEDIETSLQATLAHDVQVLAGEIGVRNRHALSGYRRAADHIELRLRAAGLEPQRQPSPPRQPSLTPGNVWAEIRGTTRASEIVIVGAHYDSSADSPGANDNASGVASVLALADRLADSAPERTLRFVLFVDEEPPYFQTDEMGSLVFARACQERGETIVGMLSLETIGWYSDDPGTQRYPRPLSAMYPDRGNFVGFVANVASRALLHEIIGGFREDTEFPSEGAALPGAMPGVSWSDHWAFWQTNVPALMITDTAPFRYPHYHTVDDTPDKVNAEKMARVVRGLEGVLRRLTSEVRSDPAR